MNTRTAGGKDHLVAVQGGSGTLRVTMRSRGSSMKKMGMTRYSGRSSLGCVCSAGSGGSYARDLSAAPRLIQHKNEAKAFYAFLSQVYDYIVNPGTLSISDLSISFQKKRAVVFLCNVKCNTV